MPQSSPGSIKAHGLLGHSPGFVLLEVLVAMSLIAGSWVALGDRFRALILRFEQLQTQKANGFRALDRHELSLIVQHSAHNGVRIPKEGLNESAGMSRRSRPRSGAIRTPY